MIQKLNGRTMLQMQCLRGKPYDLLACQSAHLASEAVEVFVVAAFAPWQHGRPGKIPAEELRAASDQQKYGPQH